MRPGLVLSADYLPIEVILKLGKTADSFNFSQISVPEIWGHDNVTTLTLLAHETEKIELASGIINMYSRSAALTAMTASSLDEISQGRFILGLGLSGPKVVNNLHGRNFAKPLTHSKEYVQVVRNYIARERFELNSDLLGDLRDFKISFPPTRKSIPIHIASLGPKNVEFTAKETDGWIPVIMPISELEEKTNHVHSILKSNNRDIDNFSITPFVLTISGDGEKETKLLRSHLAYYFGGMGDFYNNMLTRAGYEQEAVEIKEKFLMRDVNGAAQAISDEMLRNICAYGSKEEIMDYFENLRKIGINRPLLSIPFYSSIEQAEKTLQVFDSVEF